MNKELFGVFGDGSEFDRFRSRTAFDRVVEGPSVTVGVRDVGLDIPGRTGTYTGEAGLCVLWGEVYPPGGVPARAAEWVAERYQEVGLDVFGELNGSFLAVIDTGDEAFVVNDSVRTWECYFSDEPGVRVFGTDPATVAETITSPTLASDPLLEYVHLGVVLGDRTTVEGLSRIPFDAAISADGTRSLDRFVYDPQEFDYAKELARRLQRAIRRRAHLPGRKGIMLSAGYDSRTVLSQLPELDESYTVGAPPSQEMCVARKVAEQYDTNHTALDVDERYLNTNTEVTQYGHGLKESLHVHHAGYESQMDVDTMYHGLWCDTLLRGHFLPRDGIAIGDHTFPLNRLDPDPDPAGTLMSKLGYMPASEKIFPECGTIDETSEVFARRAIESQFAEWTDRFDTLYDGIALFGIQNQPSVPFRMHLADNYLESFIAADTELVDWHLTTPPEHRNNETFLKAIRLIDDDILRHRPPDRRFDSFQLNQIEKFLRQQVPGLTPFEGAWPDRREIYAQNDFDRKLFADYPEVHDLPPRIKLRINDVTGWFNRISTNDVLLTPDDVVCPPTA